MSSLIGTQVKALQSKVQKQQLENEDGGYHKGRSGQKTQFMDDDSSDSANDDEADLNMAINENVKEKMHRAMNSTQGKWYTNEFKKVGYQGQIIDQKINKHKRNASEALR